MEWPSFSNAGVGVQRRDLARSGSCCLRCVRLCARLCMVVSAPWTVVSARCDRLRSWQIGRVAIIFGYRLI